MQQPTKTQTRHQRVALTLILVVLTSFVLAGCAGAGEPKVVATVPPEPTLIPDAGYPEQLPDIAQGAALFAEHCVDCHGEFGQGNGPMVLSGQVETLIRDFTDPATTTVQSPKQWFTSISEGNLQTLMPPWKRSMSEKSRWDVAFYTYTLNYQPENITEGQALWRATCSECHGADGTGIDGVGDLTDPATLVAMADTELIEALTVDKGDITHDFSADLDADQQISLVQYLRVLGFANDERLVQINETAVDDATPDAVEPTAVHSSAETNTETDDIAEETPAAEPVIGEVFGTVTGTIINGTAGADILPDMAVELFIFESDGSHTSIETLADAEGAFTFEAVPMNAGMSYQAAVFYLEDFFASQIVPSDPDSLTLDLPITIFEVTDDPSVIVSSGVFFQAAPTGAELQVAQFVYFANTSDKLFWPRLDNLGGQHGSVTMQIPANASQLQLMSAPEDYVIAEDGTTVTYLPSLFPGEEVVIRLFYTLPNADEVKVELPIEYITDGWLTVFTPESLSVKGDGIVDLGPQAGEQGVFLAFEKELALAKGDTLAFQFEAEGGSSSGSSSRLDRNTLLALLLVAGGVLMIFGAGFLFISERRTRRVSPEDKQLLIDSLVQKIAELDKMHNAGEVAEDDYQTERSKLKKRLAKHMKKK